MIKAFKPALTALFLTAAFQAAAAPYPTHDMNRIVQPNRIDLAAADAVIGDLNRHAGDYPVQFDRPAERQRAQQEAAMLIRLFDALLEQNVITRKDSDYPAMLRRLARLNWMAHNMDMPGHAAAADRRYRALLAVTPATDKPALQSEYGGFLAATAQTGAAVSMLQKAVKGGYTPAGKLLALAYLAQGKNAQAKSALRSYVQKHPADTQAKTLLDAVERGKVQIKQHR